jgi:succinoglycan biosynthesis protein ExoM
MARPATISIIIPTQRRPSSLATAARSALAQVGIGAPEVELVVVDNDVAGSAAARVEALRADAPFPIRYVHEPKSGVANARNAGVAAASGSLIAFLDDDEEAPPGWLAALLEAQSRFDADVVFGPVRGRAPEGPLPHRAYLEDFFSRKGPAEAGVTRDYHGCGCSLVRRAALPDPLAPFSAARNQTGGEDDLLFAGMQAAGARFAWAPEAWVWEDPVPSRLSLGYAIARAFVYGQGPTYHCATATPPDIPGVARWMAIGLAQTGAYGLIAGLKWLAGAPDRAFVLDRAARGLGKLLWWGPFKLRLYGQIESPKSQG